MLSTSATWKALWASGAALEVRAEIGGTVYGELAAPVITRAATRDGPSVGGVVSAMCRLALRTGDAIPKSAEVKLSMRLTDGESASEWQPAGTYYISRRSRDPVTGVLTLECYDALLRANGVWAFEAEGWPRTMTLAAAELAGALGLELDGRTSLGAGPADVMEKPDAGTTLREALAEIAAVNGGNWIVTPAGKLRLVPLAGAGDGVEARAVLGSARTGSGATVTGVRNLDDAGAILIGEDGGVVVEVSLTEAQAEALADRLIGTPWQPFELTGAVYDPAAELGDWITYAGGVAGPLCQETATLGPAFRGDISAPEPAELADEYPYLGGDGQGLRALRAAVTVLEESAVAQVRTEYAQGESAAVPPSDGWSALPPERAEGLYVWQRTVTLYAGGRSAVSEPVNISGADGEPASVLRIDSSRGTVFKNNQVSTTLSAVIYRGSDRVTDIAALRRVFGPGAYLQWRWQRMDEDRFGLIAPDDGRIGGDGFTLTLSAEDVDTKVTFMCELVVD